MLAKKEALVSCIFSRGLGRRVAVRSGDSDGGRRDGRFLGRRRHRLRRRRVRIRGCLGGL